MKSWTASASWKTFLLRQSSKDRWCRFLGGKLQIFRSAKKLDSTWLDLCGIRKQLQCQWTCVSSLALLKGLCVCVLGRWMSAWDRLSARYLCIPLSLRSLGLHPEAIPVGSVFFCQRRGRGYEFAERQQRERGGRRKRLRGWHKKDKRFSFSLYSPNSYDSLSSGLIICKMSKNRTHTGSLRQKCLTKTLKSQMTHFMRGLNIN